MVHAGTSLFFCLAHAKTKVSAKFHVAKQMNNARALQKNPNGTYWQFWFWSEAKRIISVTVASVHETSWAFQQPTRFFFELGACSGMYGDE